jgi:hypothetical protein
MWTSDMGDLTNPRWIVAKGVLFALIVVMSGAGIVFYDDPWQKLVLLLICLWGACRFYYFLFHVLERYVGLGGRYTGLVDLFQRLWQRWRQ